MAERFGMASACALAIFSGKNIYNFAILENLRIFQNRLFTGGVVTASGSCSARKTFPAGRWIAAKRQDERGTPAARMFPQETSAANAVHLCSPSREKAILENPQIFQNCELKIIFPLNMAKAHAAAIPNRPSPLAPKPPGAI